MNATTQQITAEIEQAKQLIGGEIVGTAQDGESFGLKIKLPSGKIVVAWVDTDPEGNGPGHLSIQGK